MAQNCESKEYRGSPHAGTWYPGTEKELNAKLEDYLGSARSKAHGEILALISPHAGYMYSGPVAAFAYKTVEDKDFDDRTKSLPRIPGRFSRYHGWPHDPFGKSRI